MPEGSATTRYCRNPVIGLVQRPPMDGIFRAWLFSPGWAVAIILFAATPVARESPSAATLKTRQAQEIVDELRAALAIPSEVQAAVVLYNPRVFSVEPVDALKSRFLLSIEQGFLQILEPDELRAALAHELGHVWIFTHHPFLQTERLANEIGLRVVRRNSFERVYWKLWAYERSAGVPMDRLLGPSPHSTVF